MKFNITPKLQSIEEESSVAKQKREEKELIARKLDNELGEKKYPLIPRWINEDASIKIMDGSAELIVTKISNWMAKVDITLNLPDQEPLEWSNLRAGQSREFTLNNRRYILTVLASETKKERKPNPQRANVSIMRL